MPSRHEVDAGNCIDEKSERTRDHRSRLDSRVLFTLAEYRQRERCQRDRGRRTEQPRKTLGPQDVTHYGKSRDDKAAQQKSLYQHPRSVVICRI